MPGEGGWCLQGSLHTAEEVKYTGMRAEMPRGHGDGIGGSWKTSVVASTSDLLFNHG